MGLDITGLGSVFDFGSKVIDKLFPDKNEATRAKISLMEMQQKGELAELDATLKVALAQASTNTEEAKNASIFVSGWRPAVGWVCVTSLGYNYIFMPFFTYCANWWFKAPAMPALDTGELTTILIGMLGLIASRSFDKRVKLDCAK